MIKLVWLKEPIWASDQPYSVFPSLVSNSPRYSNSRQFHVIVFTQVPFHIQGEFAQFLPISSVKSHSLFCIFGEMCTVSLFERGPTICIFGKGAQFPSTYSAKAHSFTLLFQHKRIVSFCVLAKDAPLNQDNFSPTASCTLYRDTRVIKKTEYGWKNRTQNQPGAHSFIALTWERVCSCAVYSGTRGVTFKFKYLYEIKFIFEMNLGYGLGDQKWVLLMKE